ncbi:hypothetical protein MY11210_001825 [Beauveria gryllotalpidicola]
MKFTIFSTLCLGFSSAALAATVPEATHELSERGMRDRLCRRTVFQDNLTDMESDDDDTDVPEPEDSLQARGRNFPGRARAPAAENAFAATNFAARTTVTAPTRTPVSAAYAPSKKGHWAWAISD